MNKTLTALVALSLAGISTLAMANDNAPRQGKNPAAKQAMVECRAEIGKPLPTKPTTDNTDKTGEFKKGEFKKGDRPKLTEQERKAMGECMSKKGFSKPEKRERPHGQRPQATQQAS